MAAEGSLKQAPQEAAKQLLEPEVKGQVFAEIRGDVIGNKDKTFQPFAGLRKYENHYYHNCNIFQKIDFLVHAHNNDKL